MTDYKTTKKPRNAHAIGKSLGHITAEMIDAELRYAKEPKEPNVFIISVLALAVEDCKAALEKLRRIRHDPLRPVDSN